MDLYTKKREHFIRALVEGKKEISEREIRQRCTALGISDLEPPFAVVVTAPVYSELDYAEKDKVIIGVEETVAAFFASQHICNHTYTDSYDNAISLLSMHTCGKEKALLDKLCISLYKKLSTKYGLELFIGIGSQVGTLSEISQAFNDAQEMLGYKFQYSAKGVVNIENITRLQFSSSIGNNIAFERVLGCFKDGNLGKLAVRLDELILYVRTRPYSSKTSIRRTFTELAVRVINIASDTGVDVDSILGQTNIYQWILEQNHTEILTEWFLKLCTELVALMSSQLHSSARDVIREATGYIDANLGSPDLGLATICEHIGLSPSYFSQLFKSETGKGITNYITDQRIASAKKLLANTDHSVADISMQLGFSSVNYFSQVFKRNVGYTASDYRRKYVKP